MNLRPIFKFSVIFFIVSSLGLVTTSVYLFTSQIPDVTALVNHGSSGGAPTPMTWALRFQQAGDEIIWRSMVSAGDGVILPVVEANPGGGEYGDQLLLKVNTEGALVWQLALAWPGYDGRLRQIGPTADGGYILSRDGGTISKLDAMGSEEWSKRYILPYTYLIYDGFPASTIQQTSEGGYIVAGTAPYCNPPGTNCVSPEMVVLKVDAQGTILWARRYHNLWDLSSGQQTQDGGYIAPTI